ncbi:MAG TPA: hypothetical protein VFO76_12600 [Candidatus Kapabacteria bacterium]|nr:hypothetical protein [Candidatus Kapabacteria bacterium]
MLQSIRNIALPLGHGSSSERLRAVLCRLLFITYGFVFLADTINIGVIYSSLFGTVEFVDDSDIFDSLFDVGGSTASAIATYQGSTAPMSIERNAVERSSSGVHTVLEDIDSQGIEDAQTPVTISDRISYYHESQEAIAATVTFDRTLHFRQFLI